MSRDYLNDLNKEQRRAVEQGASDQGSFRSGPLLVIAGAGSGKTKTLAHRVAHLIGVDPQRLLLLTFSRRAAIEMTRRVEKITAAALGTEPSVVRYLPRHRGPTVAGICEPDWVKAVVYDP